MSHSSVESSGILTSRNEMAQMVAPNYSRLESLNSFRCRLETYIGNITTDYHKPRLNIKIDWKQDNEIANKLSILEKVR